MPVIDAPLRMGRRAEAKELLSAVPLRLDGLAVEIVFPPGAYPTTSFLDEVIRSVLIDRRAKLLTLRNAGERTSEVAQFSAMDLGVEDRLVIE